MAAMSSFLVSENIRRFKTLLAEDLDPARRGTVEILLEEEEGKLGASCAKEGGAAEAPPSGGDHHGS